MPYANYCEPLVKEEQEIKYKARVIYNIPEEEIEKVKEALKESYFPVYSPCYKSYDFKSRRFKPRGDIDKNKNDVQGGLQIYNIKMHDENMIKAMRYPYKITTDYDAEKHLYTFYVKRDEKGSVYSFFTSLDGKTRYYYNERTKRKLSSNQQFNTWCNASSVCIDDAILNIDGVKRSSFDKLIKLFKKRFDTRISHSVEAIIKYFNYRIKYPEIDNLIQKEFMFVYDLIDNNINFYNYFFEGRSFKKNFIVPKECHEFVFDKANKSNDGFKYLGSLNKLQHHTKALNKEIVEKMQTMATSGNRYYYNRENFYEVIREIVVEYNLDIKQVIAYLERVDDYQAIVANESITLWRDYLASAKKMGLTDYDKYPSSLKREHDVFAREAVKKKDEIEEKSFEEQMAPFADWTYEKGDFCIVVPKIAEDLKEEGRNLSHCVGTYVGKVASGKSKIFFIRHKDNPEKALYTLEIQDDRMAQYRGKHNCNPTQEARDFADDFILEKFRGLKKGEVAGLAM